MTVGGNVFCRVCRAREGNKKKGWRQKKDRISMREADHWVLSYQFWETGPYIRRAKIEQADPTQHLTCIPPAAIRQASLLLQPRWAIGLKFSPS